MTSQSSIGHSLQKTVKQIVEEEIEEYKKKWGERWYVYFNNFAGNLPFGWHRKQVEEYMPDLLDEPEGTPGGSKRYQTVTLRQFFQDVEQVVLDVGLDLDVLERLQKSRDARVLHEYVLPAYIRLREMGYKRYPDLIA